MKTRLPPFLLVPVPVLALVLMLALLIPALALAQTAKPGDEAQQRYQKERAVCLAGTGPQDRATCLKEAGAALAESRRQGLTDPGQDTASHQRQRCQVLPAADRGACLARMSGQGTSSGSVAGGGILRELRTVVPAASPPAVMPASAALR